MVLDEIGGYLQTNQVGKLGETIFLGILPDAPDDVIAIYEYGGEQPYYVHDKVGISYDTPRVQFVVRSSSYSTARQTADTLYKLMGRCVNKVVGGTYYVAIQPLQPPFLLNRDANQRVLIAFNAQVIKEA